MTVSVRPWDPPKPKDRRRRNVPIAVAKIGCEDWWAPCEEIVARIMTQHWDMKACDCWVCVAGRAAKIGPNELFLSTGDVRPRVTVARAIA